MARLQTKLNRKHPKKRGFGLDTKLVSPPINFRLTRFSVTRRETLEAALLQFSSRVESLLSSQHTHTVWTWRSRDSHSSKRIHVHLSAVNQNWGRFGLLHSPSLPHSHLSCLLVPSYTTPSHPLVYFTPACLAAQWPTVGCWQWMTVVVVVVMVVVKGDCPTILASRGWWTVMGDEKATQFLVTGCRGWCCRTVCRRVNSDPLYAGSLIWVKSLCVSHSCEYHGPSPAALQIHY